MSHPELYINCICSQKEENFTDQGKETPKVSCQQNGAIQRYIKFLQLLQILRSSLIDVHQSPFNSPIVGICSVWSKQTCGLDPWAR